MLAENIGVSTISASADSITAPEPTLMAVTSSAVMPGKPYKEFAFFPHPNRQWCEKIRGKPSYFSMWEDHEAALHRYLDDVDDIQAGRDARRQGVVLVSSSNSNRITLEYSGSRP
jgi:hypothetical protein